MISYPSFSLKRFKNTFYLQSIKNVNVDNVMLKNIYFLFCIYIFFSTYLMFEPLDVANITN